MVAQLLGSDGKIELAIIICHTFLLRDAITEYISSLRNEWQKKNIRHCHV